MTTSLERALEASRADIEKGIAEAMLELAACRDRCAELEALIARAHAALGTGGSLLAPTTPMTLHEAIRRVLTDHGNEWMTARSIGDEVNARQLYRKRDGSPVGVNQVHARTNNYTDLFEKADGRIRLKTGQLAEP
jgi:hypothetical protein